MNRTLASCLAAVALAGGVTIAVGAVAQAKDCYGLEAARVCVTDNPGNYPTVNPTESSIEECVYAGPTCYPAAVPVPGVTTQSGEPVTTECYIRDRTCEEYLGDD